MTDSVMIEGPAAVPLPVSPRARIDSGPLHTDSLVSIRLSEPASAPLALDDAASISAASVKSSDSVVTVEPFDQSRRRSSLDIMGGTVDLDTEMSQQLDEDALSQPPSEQEEAEEVSIEEIELASKTRTARTNSTASSDSNPVDWSELDKTEESEPRDEGSDESTAFLLARLEQENNALAKNPRVVGLQEQSAKAPRPPSIHVLKKLVEDPTAAPSRYSLLPEPPPLTELEFWAALVKDYSQTAQRLPTLTANKIKGGVPPPLRGVVWMSMVGARDQQLSDDFDRLANETSPYENMIGKDIGRSFPGVEMFKEAGGEGQSMLGKVLKVFSLYDEGIGYCQGLGFLVGPLLMQMGEKEAFCVLVKLMEKYDLRSCFMPDLAGLHLRIYQFQHLLTQHMPELSKHLAGLQVEAAYLSQWFLSFFAVTCPLPMLFRIYDVILAEGASETIMRVALSLMKRNEAKLMVQTEFEEVMQCLLGRALWEPYECNADELVNDFVGMTGIVTRDSLQKLEKEFKDAKAGDAADPVVRAGFFPDVSRAATGFLGRLWVSHGASKSQTNLTAPVTPSAPRGSFLRRAPSKQSIATINSTDMSSEGTESISTNTTDATAISRDSSGEETPSGESKPESLLVPILGGAVTKEDKDLHGQIEDLLTALSEMQRDQSVLTSQLQKEREEREEDHKIFHDLLSRVKSDKPLSPSTADRRQTAPSLAHLQSTSALSAELADVVERVEERLAAHRDLRRSSMMETKQRLRDSLMRNKDALGVEMSRSIELSRRLDEQEQETISVREQLSQASARIQDGMRERQKLERQIQEMRTTYNRMSVASNWSEGSATGDSASFKRRDTLESSTRMSSGSSSSNSPTTPASGGLRELSLKPGKRDSGSLTPQPSRPARGSSLATQHILSTKDHAPAPEDQMLVELVAAKTAEAVARQELEEVKAKLESMRKMLAAPQPPSPAATPAATSGPTSWLTGGSKATVAAVDTDQTALASTPNRQKTPTPPDSGLSPPPNTATTPGSGTWFPWARRTASTTTATVPDDKRDKSPAAKGKKEEPKKETA